MSTKYPHSNRLQNEKSPYLLQHAHNPVDWYAWGPEAFEKAKEEDKPIFLSIGYATCHWCHVMEKESFENLAIASLMNESFINIKVDREELPEVDSLYMDFAQSLLAGVAGWPLNIILTPGLEPFFATTYLPAHSRAGMIGMVDLVAKINAIWQSEERPKIVLQAEKIVDLFAGTIHTQGDDLPQKEDLAKTAELLYKMADPAWGGLKGSPKFPIGYLIVFLIHYYQSMKDSRGLFLAERTLDMMQRGGIYDHIGGGFSRYSVDEEWFQPHFEKMLYDNALLTQAYLEGYLVTRKPLYRRVVEEIVDYVLSEMAGPEGAFYSAEDADSEGREGLYYTWTKKEIVEALGNETAELFCEFYSVDDEGNYEEGRNILAIGSRESDFAQEVGVEETLLDEVLAEGKRILYGIRQRRVHPLKDDKILSSWNGLMIYSLVEAGTALNEERWVKAAKQAAYFIRERLWLDGELYRRFREGEVRFKGSLDEYAFMIRGALSLFEAGEGSDWLAWAIELNEVLEKNYKHSDGAYTQTDGKDPYILIQKCNYADGAEPSGNAIQTENLLRLWQITFDEKYLKAAEDVLRAVKKFIDTYPPGYTYHVMNLNRYLSNESMTLVVVLENKGVNEDFIKKCLARTYIPLKSVIYKRADDYLLEDLIPSIKDYHSKDGQTTLYICHKGFCGPALTDAEDIQKALESRRP